MVGSSQLFSPGLELDFSNLILVQMRKKRKEIKRTALLCGVIIVK